MADKYIGKLLDNRYEILQVLGTGGMAVVYKALCHRLNRYVAVKILKDEYAKDEQFRNRFHAESHAVAMLSHPNIVAVYDVSRSNSIEYIVMELIDGMTLKQYMERRGPLSQKEAVHFVTQILKALSHAHSRGIIHRDIKPHNIMLLRDSTVRVADFGIARLESSQRTVTREAFGSVHYIAPEQAKGSHIDCRADIYSTGVVLYEMLTGRLPYEGDTPVSVAIQHINSLPLSPREINSEIPEALEKITMKAMAPSVSKRYASTDDMLKDLEDFRRNPQVNIDYDAPIINEIADPDETKVMKISDDPDFYDDESDNENGKFSKIPLIAGIVTGAIFLTGVLTLLGTLLGWGGGGDVVKTPDLLGMTIEEASKEFDSFEIIESDIDMREYSDDYEEGQIIKQSPKAESTNSAGKIYVTLSRGKNDREVRLPDLKNMSEEQARIVINREGLYMVTAQENSEEVAEGNVIRTEPAAESTVMSGDSVTVYISLGKLIKDTVVPQIIGLNEEKALAALGAAKLKKGNVSYESSESPKGQVIYQSIESGTTCGEGTSVNFTVSNGPKEDKPQTQKPVTKPTGTTSQPVNGTDKPSSSDDRVSLKQTIRLPSDPESFSVKITVDGAAQYEKTHKGTDGFVDVTLKGKGKSVVCVFINDVLRQEISIDFK